MIPFTCSILKLWGASFCGCDIPKDFNCQSLNPDERDIFAGRRPLRNFPRNETETPKENNRNYGRGHRLPTQSQFDRPGPVLISALSWTLGGPGQVHEECTSLLSCVLARPASKFVNKLQVKTNWVKSWWKNVRILKSFDILVILYLLWTNKNVFKRLQMTSLKNLTPITVIQNNRKCIQRWKSFSAKCQRNNSSDLSWRCAS